MLQERRSGHDTSGKKLSIIPESLETIGIGEKPSPRGYTNSPIIHADENDRLTKVNRPSDNTTTIITVDVEIDLRPRRNELKKYKRRRTTNLETATKNPLERCG